MGSVHPLHADPATWASLVMLAMWNEGEENIEIHFAMTDTGEIEFLVLAMPEDETDEQRLSMKVAGSIREHTPPAAMNVGIIITVIPPLTQHTGNIA